MSNVCIYVYCTPGVVLVIGMRRRFSPHELFLMMIIKQSKRQVLGKKPSGKPHSILGTACLLCGGAFGSPKGKPTPNCLVSSSRGKRDLSSCCLPWWWWGKGPTASQAGGSAAQPGLGKLKLRGRTMTHSWQSWHALWYYMLLHSTIVFFWLFQMLNWVWAHWELWVTGAGFGYNIFHCNRLCIFTNSKFYLQLGGDIWNLFFKFSM